MSEEILGHRDKLLNLRELQVAYTKNRYDSQAYLEEKLGQIVKDEGMYVNVEYKETGKIYVKVTEDAGIDLYIRSSDLQAFSQILGLEKYKILHHNNYLMIIYEVK